MSIVLSIPEQQNGDNIAVETRFSQTGRWIDRLPLLNIEESLSQIQNALFELNRIKLKAQTRIKLLDLYRYSLAVISGEVNKRLQNTSLPFNSEIRSLAERVRDTHIELSYGYKASIMDLSKSWHVGGQTADLALAIHRSIRYLTESLHKSAVYYAPYPKGMWQEIHQLNLFAGSVRVRKLKVEDPLNTTQPKNTISHIYKQALLLGLLDNYRHTLPIMLKTQIFLDRWASLAVLSRLTKPATTRCQFLVDTESDRPLLTYNPEVESDNPVKYLLFDTRELTRLIHYQWLNLRQGNQPPLDGLAKGFFDDGSEEFLHKLAMAWSAIPKRKYSRTANRTPYKLAVGLEAANYFLNGRQAFKHSSAGHKSSHSITVVGINRLPTPKREQVDYNHQTWELIDHGPSGFGFKSTGDEKTQVRIGDLVISAPLLGKDKWIVGIVRWLKSTSVIDLTIGVQQLAPGAQSVAVKSVSIHNQEEDEFKLSVLLDKSDTLNRPATLVTPAGTYSADRNLFMDNGEMLYMIRTSKLVESSSQFDWFEFVELNF